MIDGYATERQYLEHLAPIWAALPAAERGEFFVAPQVVAAASLHGVGPIRIGRPGDGGPIMVAGFADHRDARRAGRSVVYVEHGAGQTYATPEGPHPSYSGSAEHDGTVLFVCPSETVAERWRVAYPGVPAVAVGCPKLDRFHAVPRGTVSPRAAGLLARAQDEGAWQALGYPDFGTYAEVEFGVTAVEAYQMAARGRRR